MNSRISTEYVSIESRRDHELLIVIFCYIQFLILFGRHYGRNAQARPPSCPIFLPMVRNSESNFQDPLLNIAI